MTNGLRAKVLCATGLTCISAYGCRATHATSDVKVINGTPVTSVDDPIYKSTAIILDSGGNLWCTGTLVAPRLVLTAAHCYYLQKDRIAGLRVAFGHGAGYSSITPVKAIMVHSKFDNEAAITQALEEKFSSLHSMESQRLADLDSRTTPLTDAEKAEFQGLANMYNQFFSDALFAPDTPVFDIALLGLASDVQTPFKPATLPEPSAMLEGNSEVIAAGYGATEDSDSSPMGTLNKGSLKVLQISGKSLEFDTIATTNQTHCYGDSGGPIYKISGQAATVFGVIARGKDEKCSEPPLGVATDVRAFRQWLSCRASEFEGAVVRDGCQSSDVTTISVSQ